MIYYAGHGIEVRGANYLLPVDVTLTTERNCGLAAVSLSRCRTACRAKKLKLIVAATPGAILLPLRW